MKTRVQEVHRKFLLKLISYYDCFLASCAKILSQLLESLTESLPFLCLLGYLRVSFGKNLCRIKELALSSVWQLILLEGVVQDLESLFCNS